MIKFNYFSVSSRHLGVWEELAKHQRFLTHHPSSQCKAGHPGVWHYFQSVCLSGFNEFVILSY